MTEDTTDNRPLEALAAVNTAIDSVEEEFNDD
jgi:hypothetical protein